MIRFKTYKAILVGFFLVFLQTGFAQFQIPENPTLQTSVYDYIDLISEKDKTALENKLVRYADTTSTQIVIAIISSTKGEDINYLAATWGHQWGVGGSGKKDNGVFVLLAKDDRKISIQTGYGVEHLLTDALSKRIIEKIIIPEFKRDNYYAGLDKGTSAIMAILNGEFSPELKEASDEKRNWVIVLLIFLVVIVFIIVVSKASKGNNDGGNFGRRSTLSDILILTGMGKSSGGSSSGGIFGGGGFSGGFGGGGFGGGGASGSW